jgi:hypothetical protein
MRRHVWVIGLLALIVSAVGLTVALKMTGSQTIACLVVDFNNSKYTVSISEKNNSYDIALDCGRRSPVRTAGFSQLRVVKKQGGVQPSLVQGGPTLVLADVQGERFRIDLAAESIIPIKK